MSHSPEGLASPSQSDLRFGGQHAPLELVRASSSSPLAFVEDHFAARLAAPDDAQLQAAEKPSMHIKLDISQFIWRLYDGCDWRSPLSAAADNTVVAVPVNVPPPVSPKESPKQRPAAEPVRSRASSAVSSEGSAADGSSPELKPLSTSSSYDSLSDAAPLLEPFTDADYDDIDAEDLKGFHADMISRRQPKRLQKVCLLHIFCLY